ncbi:MAG: acyltransferase [Pseudomonadota bacterium]
MFQALPGPVQGCVTLLLLLLNTCFCCLFLFPTAFLRLLVPLAFWQRLCGRIMTGIAVFWVGVNNLGIKITKRISWEISGLENLNPKGWYLVMANHQSWLDIVVLQKVLFRKIPFLKFFLKKELIWVPLLGQAWWALDFPFMKRYSKDFLNKHPELKGKDLETTREACKKFKTMPVSVVNFVEGTRFNLAKKVKQSAPYNHLLKPKAAGIAFVLGAMGEQFERILNVTIVYPNGLRSMWAFLCGKVRKINVIIESLPVTEEILGDYFNDDHFRIKFQGWLNDLWLDKDHLINSQLALPCPVGVSSAGPLSGNSL